MEKGGYIYIMTNKDNNVFYIGVTSNLVNRVIEHKEKKFSNSFTAKYNLNKIVYYETFQSIDEAIIREKQLKAGSRTNKKKLVESQNGNWIDLFQEISEIRLT